VRTLPETRSWLRLILIISTLGSFLTPFIGSMVNLAPPQIAVEFSDHDRLDSHYLPVIIGDVPDTSWKDQ